MKKQPNIFLSYSWKNMEIADSIDNDFKSKGIMFQRDIRDVGYMESIKKFMERIRDSGYVLMIISDEYLKSENCMYEVSEFLKEKDFQDRILLIVLENARIYDFKGKKGYIEYWKKVYEAMNNKLNELPREKSIKLSKELNKVQNIYSNIDEFLDIVGDKKSVSFSKLRENNYKDILDIVKYVNPELLDELFKISNIKDIQEREIKLDKFIENNPKFFGGYFYRAYLAAAKGDYKVAKHYYTDYLSKTFPSDAFAHNNLATLLKNEFDDIKEARKHYNEAIQINPNYAEAHNNLANLLIDKFHDKEGAIEHFEKAIEINPNFAEAHNNLALLLLDEYHDKDGAKEHYKKAIIINPNFALAYYNLALLLIIDNDKNGAKKYYEKAIETNPDYINAHYNLALLLSNEFNDKIGANVFSA